MAVGVWSLKGNIEVDSVLKKKAKWILLLPQEEVAVTEVAMCC